MAGCAENEAASQSLSRDSLRLPGLWGRGVSPLAVLGSAWAGEATLRGDSCLFHWEIASQNNRMLHLERNFKVAQFWQVKWMERWETRSLIPPTSPAAPQPLPWGVWDTLISATPRGCSLGSLKPPEVHQASPKFTLIDCDPDGKLCPGFPGDFWIYDVDIGSTSFHPQVELSFLKAEGKAPDISTGWPHSSCCNSFLWFLFIYFLNFYLSYSFISLCCCTQTFSGFGGQGLLSSCRSRLLIAMASLLRSVGPGACTWAQ